MGLILVFERLALGLISLGQLALDPGLEPGQGIRIPQVMGISTKRLRGLPLDDTVALGLDRFQGPRLRRSEIAEGVSAQSKDA